MSFIDLMKEKARQDKQTIVLPESTDKRTLIAAAQILKEGTADLDHDRQGGEDHGRRRMAGG